MKYHIEFPNSLIKNCITNPKFFYMKKVYYAFLFLLLIGQFSNAQEAGKFRVGLDLGYAIPDGGGGVLIAVEPKYNVSDNMNIGLRFESAALAKNITDGALSLEAELTSSTLIAGTFDYYFTSGSSSFAPFLGAGVGYSSLGSLSASFDGNASPEVDVDGKFGGLIRGGFEIGKVRLAATYNLIGASEVETSEIKNSYIGISFGFYFGGGKWKK